jgi:hypothetical protein
MKTNSAKVGCHFIDQLGRVVEAIPETHGCAGCIYRNYGSIGCQIKEKPLDIGCYGNRVIFKEVTDVVL